MYCGKIIIYYLPDAHGSLLKMFYFDWVRTGACILSVDYILYVHYVQYILMELY